MGTPNVYQIHLNTADYFLHDNLALVIFQTKISLDRFALWAAVFHMIAVEFGFVIVFFCAE